MCGPCRRLLPILVVSAAIAVPARAQSCFEDEPPIHIDDWATSMAAADMDGDGTMDLVIAHDELDSVSVLLNRGASPFSDEAEYPVGDEPNAVATADFDGDGLPDVVTADFRSSTLSVLLNLGGGRLAHRIQYKCTTGPFFVTTADVNGDGAPDLVALDYYSWTVSVFPNRRNGTFGPEARYYVGSYPTSVTCADIDGDGDTDLVVANYGWHAASGSLTVLLNQGNGTFTAEPEIGLAHWGSVLTIVSGDLDGDGRVDLAVPLLNEDRVLLFFNRGDGRFERMSREVSYEPAMIRLADLDADGDLDLMTLGDNGGISVLRNLGSREFTPYVYSGTRGYRAGALADFDGDGRPDLATGPLGLLLTVMRNLGDGTFAERGQLAVGGNPSSVTSADLDRDGAPELISTVQYPGAVSVLRNGGEGTFQSSVTYGVGDLPLSVASADLDGDGTPDLAVANAQSDTVSILMNQGDGTFGAQVQLAAGDYPSAVACADLNGDGRPDLAVGNRMGGSVSVLMNLGGGSFAPAVESVIGPGVIVGWTIAAEDFDRDGDTDLAVALLGAVAILRNAGDGTFGPIEFYDGYTAEYLAAGDIDGDGFPDLATTHFADDVVAVLLNRGDGTFGDPHLYLTDPHPTGVSLTDFDGDGRLDLAVASPSKDRITLFRNTGGGSMAFEARYATGWKPTALTSIDIDQDGDADIVVANSQEASLSTLRNCRSAGIVFCAGDGTGTACPCGNASAPGSRAGCVDSRGAAASLRAAGSARLAHDELVLAGADLPDGIAFYIQGATRENGGAGTVYGDGLLCAGGPLSPIGAAAIESGSASYPRPGDPSVSHRGLVLAPGTRTYQILCRDRARFCTPDTFNLSNGIEIVWGP